MTESISMQARYCKLGTDSNTTSLICGSAVYLENYRPLAPLIVEKDTTSLATCSPAFFNSLTSLTFFLSLPETITKLVAQASN